MLGDTDCIVQVILFQQPSLICHHKQYKSLTMLVAKKPLRCFVICDGQRNPPGSILAQDFDLEKVEIWLDISEDGTDNVDVW